MPLIGLPTRGKFIFTRVKIISSIIKNKNKSQVAILSLHDLMKSEDMKPQSREYEKWDDHALHKPFVATLALGLRPKLRLARVWAKREAQESHLMLPGM